MSKVLWELIPNVGSKQETKFKMLQQNQETKQVLLQQRVHGFQCSSTSTETIRTIR